MPRSANRTRKAAIWSVVSNTSIVAVKLTGGYLTGSVSVLAEGLQSLVDVVTSLMIVAAVNYSAKPADAEHPYGHGKIEGLMAAAQMILILGSVGVIWRMAYLRFFHPQPIRADWGLVAMAYAVAADFLVARYLMCVAKETRSMALEAEAQHLRGDIWASLGVMGGLLAVMLTGIPQLDPIVAVVLTGFVLWAAVDLLRRSLGSLMDTAISPEHQALIERILSADKRVLGYHKLRTRQSGTHAHIDAHITLDDSLTFEAAHAICEEIEEALRQAIGPSEVTIHFEPHIAETRHRAEAHPPD